MIKNLHTKTLLALLASLLFLFICDYNLAYGQHEVSGRVVEIQTGNALPGVNVVVVGTQRGTSTNQEGAFELGAPSPNDSLRFSFVGFQPKVVPINGRSQINVTLRSEVLTGEGVLVVGYGEQRRKETSTGAAASVSGTELEDIPVSNVSQTLGGKVPGLTMVNQSGEPGADEPILRVRGQSTLGDNEPLVVIDGIPGRSGGLARLNPSDIENITVLKDATAAIYGARAGNGVILVTTKRGREGPPEVNLQFTQGWVQPTRMPEMADAATYLTMLNEINQYRGNPPAFSEEEIQKYQNIENQDPWLYSDTDWAEAAIQDFALRSRANASVTGGSDDILYRVSFGAQTEGGILINSSRRYNQYNVRSNIDGDISSNVSVQFDLAGRLEDRNYPTQSAEATFENIVQSKPQLPAFWPNRQPGPAIEAGQNPVVMGSDVTGREEDNRYFIQSDLQLEIDIPGIEELSVRGTGSYDKTLRELKSWATPWELCNFDGGAYREAGQQNPEDFLQCGQVGLETPELTQRSEGSRDILVNAIGEYQGQTGDHSYTFLAGTEYQEFENQFFESFRTNFTSSQIAQFFAGGEARQNIDGSSSDGARLKFFGRATYDYKDKYLLEVVSRYDGSYIFPEGDRFGFFPSLSVGWRLGQEEFFGDNVGFVDKLKLRASWGQTGNDRVDPFQFLSTFRFGPGYMFNVDQEATTITPAQTPNSDITWEVANQFDVGIESQLFGNRLAFELDYFNYLREDILTFRDASIPTSTGLELPRENIGEVRSWGYDGSITYRQSVTDDLQFDVTLTGGFATNEVEFMDEPPGAPSWQRATGSKMNTRLLYKTIGVFSDQQEVENTPSWPGARPGDLIFADINGDGEITPDDRVRADRNDIPEWTGGLTLNTSWRQFDMSVFFQGAAGASQYVRTASGQFGNYYQKFAERRWTPDNTDAEGPRAFNRQEEYWMAQDNTYFFRDTDYIRLKSLRIGYNVPSSYAGRFGVENLRLYVSGANLVTWTGYDLGDPEASGDERGGRYPQTRTYNVGVNLTF